MHVGTWGCPLWGLDFGRFFGFCLLRPFACHVDPQAASVDLDEAENDDDDDDDDDEGDYENCDDSDNDVFITMMPMHMMIIIMIMMMFPLVLVMEGECLQREKTDKEKSHKGIWRSDAPEASQAQTRDVPGTPGTFGPDLCVYQY